MDLEVREQFKPGAMLQDVEAVQPPWVGELVGGTLHLRRWDTGQARLKVSVGALIHDQLRRTGERWFLLNAPEVRVGGDVLVPEVAGWRAGEGFPAAPDAPYVTKAPDWICLIMASVARDVGLRDRFDAWGRKGARAAWVVDPLEQTVECWRNEDGRWRSEGRAGGSELAVLPPFDAVALELGLLWT